MPRRRTEVPASGSSSPAINFNIVDLPEPFAPTTPTRARGSIAKSSPSSTTRLPNDLRTAFRLRRATSAALGRLRLPAGGAGLRRSLALLAALRPPARTAVLFHRATHREQRARSR